MENEEYIKTLPFLVTKVRMGPGKKLLIDAEKAIEAYESVKPIRNVVIESALEIESSLTSAVLHFIAGKNYRIYNILRELVFDTESCTFMQKRKMLSKIFEMEGENISCLTSEQSKSLRRDINYIILERNKFAHGLFVVECHDYKVGIQYYSGGEKIDFIDNTYLDVFSSLCEQCEKLLTKLNNFFKKKIQ